jgi:tetratricopeptide (TPR) repeat protein/DNA-binding CsgD family transcriptional regulator
MKISRLKMMFTWKMKRLLFLFLLVRSIGAEAQQSNPLLDWVKTHEHVQLKTCIDTLQKSIETAHAQQRYQEESRYLQKLSHLFLTRIKNFDKTMGCIEQIKTLADKTGNEEFLIDYYNQLGVTYYYEQLDMPKSFDYFKKALDLSKKLKIEKNISLTLSNYGLAYLEKENHETALSYFRQAIASYKKEYKKDGTMEFYSNMGVALIYAEKYDSASYYLDKSLLLAKETPGLDDDAERLMYLGVFNQEIGKNDKALGYLKEAFKLIHNLSSFRSKILVCEGLADAFAGVGQYKEAHDFRNKEKLYRDSLRVVSLEESSLSYKYKSELDELKNLNRLQQIEKEKEGERFQFWVVIGILFIVLLTGFVVFLVFRYRTNQKRLILQTEKEKLEKNQVTLELEANEREVAAKSMFLLEKDNLINNISDKLRATLPKLEGDAHTVVNGLISELHFSINNKRWEEFELRFNKVHPNFIQNLEKKHPRLSNNERKLCAFLLMNMSSKDISSITGQTVHSINIARSRLRIKLKLVHSGEELSSYLGKFSS